MVENQTQTQATASFIVPMRRATAAEMALIREAAQKVAKSEGKSRFKLETRRPIVKPMVATLGIWWAGVLEDATDFDNPEQMGLYLDVPTEGKWHTDIWVGSAPNFYGDSETLGFLRVTFDAGRLFFIQAQ